MKSNKTSRFFQARGYGGLGLGLGLLVGAVGCSGTLTIEVAGKGSINVLGTEEPAVCTEPLCTYQLSSGSELTLRAVDLGKGKFQAWAGDCIGEEASCTLTLDGDKTVKARFVDVYPVKLTVVGDGKISSEDGRLECPGTKCEALYSQGEELKLLRQAGRDVFDAYQGSCVGKECTMIVKQSVDITAVFSVPAGSVVRGATAGPGVLGKDQVGLAFDEKGGWVVVSIVDKTAHLNRFDAAGKSLFAITQKVGATQYPPGVAFFGDDIILLTSTDTSAQISRISPDGKTVRFNRLHKGCSALRFIEVGADAIFAAGDFDRTGSTCGDKELISSGGKDILVVRFAVEDGGLTWASQLGSGKDDELTTLSVARSEDSWVGYNRGDRGGHVVRLNPAGKAYPELPFGKGGDTQVLDLSLRGNDRVGISGHVFSVVDFGGASLGTSAKDGAGRAVWVEVDYDGRHKASKLIARSRCGDGWLCVFDAKGGFVRLERTDDDDSSPNSPPKKKKGKPAKAPNSVRFSANRLSDDGTERWSARFKGSGFGDFSLARISPKGNVFVVGVLDGELKLSNEARLTTRGPSVFFVELKD